MKIRIITSALALTMACTAWAWGRIGHDAVTAIAEANLTPTAKATIENYLDGKSIIYYASWMDNNRLTPEYKHTDGWHSSSFDANGKQKIWKDRYMAHVGINHEMEKVEDGKYKEMTDSAVAVSIKLLVHMVADMHCPSHIFFEGTPQSFYFTVNDNKYKFHKFFDGGIFDLGHMWYYADYQYQLDRCTPQQKAELTAGTLTEWEEGNAVIMRPLYDILTPDRVFDRPESLELIRNMTTLVDDQLLKAGYRLAHVLNSVFDPEYPRWER